MTSYINGAPYWPPPVGTPGHSTEVEHRLTVQEQFTELQKALNEKLEKRMTLLERALIAVVMALHALAHEKLPEWAKFAAGLLKAGMAASH